MEDVDEIIEFVNQQREFHLRQVDRFKGEPRRKELHSSTALKFSRLAEFIGKLHETSLNRSESISETDGINLSWGEVQNLPPELMEELSITDSDLLDFKIVSAIDRAGGVASLDRILVSLFEQTGEVHKRIGINNRIYRIIQKGLVFGVEGRKGVYTTSKPKNDDNTSDEIEDLLG